MNDTITLVGTGLSGLTLAASLAAKGFNVTLIGPVPDTKSDGRSTAILAPNIAFLESVGLWPAAAADAAPLLRMELIDAGETFSFDCREMGLPQFGFNVANDALKAALARAVTKNRRITWHKTLLKKAVRAPQGWSLSLADGEKIQTCLLIGADGRASAVRMAAGIACDEKDGPQAALVVTVASRQAHRHTTVERYRAGGPFTLVPCADGTLALVWCDDAEILRNAAKLSARDLSARITDLSEKSFGVLTVVTKPQLWPIRPMKARRLVAPHTALIGEAAHVLPPIGAQGFNAGLHDIAALCGALERGKTLGLPSHDFAILSDYARRRAGDIAARYHGINVLNAMIRGETPLVRQARRMALRGLTRIAPLKRSLMIFGMGEAA